MVMMGASTCPTASLAGLVRFGLLNDAGGPVPVWNERILTILVRRSP